MFAVLPKKTKGTKEVRDTDTEDSGEEDGAHGWSAEDVAAV
jgi:hypothetical protein